LTFSVHALSTAGSKLCTQADFHSDFVTEEIHSFCPTPKTHSYSTTVVKKERIHTFTLNRSLRVLCNWLQSISKWNN